MRLEHGRVHDVVDVAGVGPVAVEYERCAAGWQASFMVPCADPGAALADVRHRLVAGSIGEARRAVPDAVAFLLGERPDDAPVIG